MSVRELAAAAGVNIALISYHFRNKEGLLLEKLVSENFDQSSSAFIAALCECLSHLSKTDVCWRFHFMLGTIYYTAAGPHRIYAFSNGK